MLVRNILADKEPRAVVSLPPDAQVEEAARHLSENAIGVVLVIDAKNRLHGILSERDIVRAVARHGAAALESRIAELMTADVVSCAPDDRIVEIMHIMTERKFRHMPVRDGGRIIGMISIGDVVKRRLNDTVSEVENLKGYVAGLVG